MEHLPFLRDLQDTAALVRCCLCQGEIYAGEGYYQTDDGPVCSTCFRLGIETDSLPLRCVPVPAGEAAG